jgi:hypothetical protein
LRLIVDARLRHLINGLPSWFVLQETTAKDFTGFARLPQTVWADSGVRIKIFVRHNIAVQEDVPGTVFPARCPERHIQADKTFCLGLVQLNIQSTDIAHQWWRQFEQYIRCQSVAEQTGLWPLEHALDHGDAGKHHLRALEISESLNIRTEYDAAYNGEESWITSRDFRLLGKDDKPINGRSPCPRGCRHKRRPSRPIVRKSCKSRALLLELVICERKRRLELERYWASCRKDGETCCGRMRRCGLPPASAQPSEAINNLAGGKHD